MVKIYFVFVIFYISNHAKVVKNTMRLILPPPLSDIETVPTIGNRSQRENA